MVLEYAHLNFYKTIKKKAKYSSNFGEASSLTTYNKQHREEHFSKLSSSISHLEKYYNAYFANKKNNLGKNIFKEIPLLLEIDPAANIFDDLHKYGLEFICEDEDGFVLVATNLEGLNAFKE